MLERKKNSGLKQLNARGQWFSTQAPFWFWK